MTTSSESTTVKAWDVRWEGLLPARPEAIWDAVTVHADGYAWPVAFEPRVGGAERGLTAGGGTVTAWEPLRRFATRTRPETERDGLNELTYDFEARDGGATTYLRYSHRAEISLDDYDLQLTMCRAHTTFYLHSLGVYAAHFGGRAAAYVTADAPATTSFAAVRRALGLADDVVAGDRVVLTPDGGLDRIEGVVDYATGPFLGIRTEDALLRVFGRDRWGYAVGLGHHLFAPGADADAATAAWSSWLDSVGSDVEAVA